jgi:hypothetical protein
MQENGKAEEISTVEFTDDGLYEATCPKGHKSITILQQRKFEILFDIGIYAINDGYYREAISSFTASLERFNEFFIKIVCISKGVEQNEINDSWKEISVQSERQLGAFIFLYLLEYGNKPPLLSTDNVKFRNAVIHKGKIPSKKEAIDYGQVVFDVIKPTLEKLKERYRDIMDQYVLSQLEETRKGTDKALPLVTLSIPTILSIAHDQPFHEEIDIKKIVEMRA